MYYGRKKGIIIAIIVVSILLVVGIGGTCLYMFTDLFKSKEKLFWKYMEKGVANLEISSNLQMEEIQKKKQQTPYTTNSKVTLSSSNEQINKQLQGVQLTLDGQTDKQNNYSYLESELEYNYSKIFDLKYVHDEDVYALKSDEIVNAFVGVRNKNLNVLMQKLGVTATFDIPNEIVLEDYSNLLEMTQEEQNHINETYSNIIMKNITKECYSRQTEAVIEKDSVSYTTTSYRLDLSSNDMFNIVSNILTTLKTDSVTLNSIATKASEVGLEEYATVDEINNVIDNMIENLEEIDFIDASLIVYSYKGETLAIEILLKDISRITIYPGNVIKVKYENFDDDSQFEIMNIEMSIKNTTTQSSMYINANVDDETEVELNIENIGSATNGNLDTNITASIIINGETYEMECTRKIEFVDELEQKQKLDRTNCAVLNDYSQQDLNTLVQAIKNQIITVFNQKMEMIETRPLVNNDQLPQITM